MNIKNPLNKGDFWIAAIGDLSDENKENAKELVKFLGNYKIRIADGKEGRADPNLRGRASAKRFLKGNGITEGGYPKMLRL